MLSIIFDQLMPKSTFAGIVLLVASTSFIGLAALLFISDVFHSLCAIKLEMIFL